jgi:YfiH family protein
MRLVQFEGRRGFVFEQIEAELGLPHVFTAKSGDGSGNLSLSGGRCQKSAIAERESWSRFLGVPSKDWIVGGQSHGSHVQVVDHRHRGRGALSPETVLPETDGLVTTTSGLPLYVASADCATVLLASKSKTPGLAVIHSGWRGAAEGIVPKGIAKLLEQSKADACSIFAGISPCIGLANFEVGNEVASKVPAARKMIREQRWHVDLAGWIEDQILESGIALDRIEIAQLDTVESSELFFSHRGEGDRTGRMGLVASGNWPL